MSLAPAGRPAIRQTSAGVRVDVRVTPRSSRSEIGVIREERVSIRVTAPPVDDAANAAVIDLLARATGAPRGSVRVVGGATSRMKTVEIAGVSVEQVRAALFRHP